MPDDDNTDANDETDKANIDGKEYDTEVYDDRAFYSLLLKVNIIAIPWMIPLVDIHCQFNKLNNYFIPFSNET